MEQSVLLPASRSPFELGASLGQVQAFRTVAKHCTAAAARQLQQIRNERSYEALGLSWEQFCVRHAGISRAYADKLIRRLEEFGEPYFQLRGIARVSPESYRQLAPAVSAESIEVGGEAIPLTPENAPRIRKALDTLRQELRRAQQTEPDPEFTMVKIRLDACFEQMSQLTRNPDAGTRAALRGLVHYSIEKLTRIGQSVGA